MGREFELKYQAEPETLALLRSKFGEFTRISMETTYYDTADLALRQRKWTLRQRLENGQVAYQPQQSQPKPEKPKVLLLPQASPSTSRVHAYLRSRGIDSDLIDFCIQTGRVYESTPHHNAVFVILSLILMIVRTSRDD